MVYPWPILFTGRVGGTNRSPDTWSSQSTQIWIRYLPAFFNRGRHYHSRAPKDTLGPQSRMDEAAMAMNSTEPFAESLHGGTCTASQAPKPKVLSPYHDMKSDLLLQSRVLAEHCSLKFTSVSIDIPENLKENVQLALGPTAVYYLVRASRTCWLQW